jgi:integrase/recombinase XerC
MMENGEAATTVNRKLSTLRTFYKFLTARGIVEQTPVRNIKGPKVSKPLPQFVRDSEMKSILDSTESDADFVSVRNRCILALFYETGIRLAELISLNNDDIDFGNGTLKVTGKRDKQRIIPFANRLADQLKDYMELRDAEIDVKDSDALFLNIKGGRIPRHQVYHLVKDALKESNVEKKSPHVLRHTFATSMLNNDAELGAVKELLGHNSLATTEVYVHITFQELKEIYKQAHPRA